MTMREQQHDPDADAVCLEGVSYRYDGGKGGAPGAASGETSGETSGGTSGDTSGGGGGRRWAVRDVTLHVARGVSLGVIGPNGGGKTTLIKLILGLLQPTTGTVRVLGQTPKQATRAGGLIGYVPQRHGAQWRFPLTAGQVVKMGLVGHTKMLRRPSKADRDYAEGLIDTVGVRSFAGKPIGALSGGQQQRVFIARALAAQPSVLLLDEPTVGIDQAGQQRFAELLHELHEGLGLTLIIVSHDLRAIAAGCERVACLNQSIHYHDAPAGLTADVLGEVFEHEIGIRGWGLGLRA